MRAPPDMPPELAFLLGLTFLLGIHLGLAVALSAHLRGLLFRIPPEHQKIAPHLLWLLLLPVWNLLWLPYVTVQIERSRLATGAKVFPTLLFPLLIAPLPLLGFLGLPFVNLAFLLALVLALVYARFFPSGNEPNTTPA
ncbi:MAG: hypothetical protein SNJ52_03565 [Verrucomicrobiia bacterium]